MSAEMNVSETALAFMVSVLGHAESHEVLMKLLKEAKGDPQRAIEVYFSSQPSTRPRSPNTSSPVLDPPRIETHAHEEYQVVFGSSHRSFDWTIDCILNRVVVVEVVPQGNAERKGVRKGDVVLMMNSEHVDGLNWERVSRELVSQDHRQPIELKLRRSISKIYPRPILNSSSHSNHLPSQSRRSYGPAQILDHVGQIQAFVNNPSVSRTTVFEFYLNSEMSIEKALDRYFSMNGILPDFQHLVGSERITGASRKIGREDEEEEESCYDITLIETGPLAMTVENIMERTIIVQVKSNGVAERANIRPSSWILEVNDMNVLGLSHKDVLRKMRIGARPLHLKLLPLSAIELTLLRRQLKVSTRQTHELGTRADKPVKHYSVALQALMEAIFIFPEAVARDLYDEFYGLKKNSVITATNDLDYRKEIIDRINEVVGALPTLKEGNVSNQTEEKMVLAVLRIFSETDKVVFEYFGRDSVEENHFWLYLRSFLWIVENMLMVENHKVWVMAISSLIKLTSGLLMEHTVSHIIPLTVRLSVHHCPVARIAALHLFLHLYPKFLIGNQDIRIQLCGMIDRLILDESQLVRRSVAFSLGELAGVISSQNIVITEDTHIAWILYGLEELMKDPHELVRRFAVDSIAKVTNTVCHHWINTRMVSQKMKEEVIRTEEDDNNDVKIQQQLRLLRCQIVPIINAAATDPACQVRKRTTLYLPMIYFGLGKNYADVIIDQYVELLKDKVKEVRSSSASSIVYFCQAMISLDRITNDEDEIMIPSLINNKDKVKNNRDEIHDESTGAAEIEPFIVFVKHTCPSLPARPNPHLEETLNMRNAVYDKIFSTIFSAAFTTITSESNILTRALLAKALGECIPFVVKSSKWPDIIPTIIQLLEDQAAAVRMAISLALAQHESLLDFLSIEIIDQFLLPCIHLLAQDKVWRVRLKVLDIIPPLLIHLSSQELIPGDSLIHHLLQLYQDNVAQVRRYAMQVIIDLAQELGWNWLEKTKVLSRLFKTLECSPAPLSYHVRIATLTILKALVVDDCSNISEEFIALYKKKDSTLSVELVQAVRPYLQSRAFTLRLCALHIMLHLYSDKMNIGDEAAASISSLLETSIVFESTAHSQSSHDDIQALEKQLSQLVLTHPAKGT